MVPSVVVASFSPDSVGEPRAFHHLNWGYDVALEVSPIPASLLQSFR